MIGSVITCDMYIILCNICNICVIGSLICRTRLWEIVNVAVLALSEITQKQMHKSFFQSNEVLKFERKNTKYYQDRFFQKKLHIIAGCIVFFSF